MFRKDSGGVGAAAVAPPLHPGGLRKVFLPMSPGRLGPGPRGQAKKALNLQVDITQPGLRKTPRTAGWLRVLGTGGAGSAPRLCSGRPACGTAGSCVPLLQVRGPERLSDLPQGIQQRRENLEPSQAGKRQVAWPGSVPPRRLCSEGTCHPSRQREGLPGSQTLTAQELLGIQTVHTQAWIPGVSQ